MATPVTPINPFRDKPVVKTAAPVLYPSGSGNTTNNTNANDNPYSGLNTNVNKNNLNNYDPKSYFNPIRDEITGIQKDIKDSSSRIVTSGDIDYYKGLMGDNQYETDFRTGIDKVKAYTDPNSDINKFFADSYLSKFDASSAAQVKAQAQRIANNPYITTGAKSAAIAEQMRQAGSDRSNLVGKLAGDAQTRSYEATKTYAELAKAGMTYEQGKFKDAFTAAENSIQRKLNGDISNLDAAMKKGDLSITEATMELNKITEELKASQYEFENKFNVEKAIADYENNKVARDEATERIITAREARIDTYKKTAGTILSNQLTKMRVDNPDAVLTLDDVKGNALAMEAMTSWYTAVRGDPTDRDAFDTWIRGRLTEVDTLEDQTKVDLDNKIQTLRDSFIKDSDEDTEGWMTPETWDEVEGHISALLQAGGNLTTYKDSTGKERFGFKWGDGVLKDVDGNEIDMDIADTPKATVDSFNTWKSKELFKADTEGYSDDQVYDAYTAIIAKGEKPTRDNIKAALKAMPVADVSKSTYNDLSTKLTDSGAKGGSFVVDGEIPLTSTEIDKLIARENVSDKKDFTISKDVLDFVDMAGIGDVEHSGQTKKMIDELTARVGKIMTLDGKQVVLIGRRGKNYNTWWFYDPETKDEVSKTNAELYNMKKNSSYTSTEPEKGLPSRSR